MFEYLKLGEENAIKSEELEKITGHDKRTVQAIIERERELDIATYNGEHVFICASVNGYFLSNDPEEVFRFYKRYTASAKRIFRTSRHFKHFLEGVKGQIDLADIEGQETCKEA